MAGGSSSDDEPSGKGATGFDDRRCALDGDADAALCGESMRRRRPAATAATPCPDSAASRRDWRGQPGLILGQMLQLTQTKLNVQQTLYFRL